MSKQNSTLTAERLREILDYDPETGEFTRKLPKYMAGRSAGCHTEKYTYVRVDGVAYLAHRVAWMYMTGAWPSLVDHINGNKSDNRFCNLRAADDVTNQQNRRKAQTSSASGLIGAFPNKRRALSPWRSAIRVNGRSVQLGTYKTAQEAHEAYVEAKRRLHAGCTI